MGSTSIDSDEVEMQAAEWVLLINVSEERWEEVYLMTMRRRRHHGNLSVTELNQTWDEMQAENVPRAVITCEACNSVNDNTAPPGYECPFHGPKARARYASQFRRVQ